jgi:4'-phosphopantetheinyl transferase
MLRVISTNSDDQWSLRSNQVHIWLLDPALLADPELRTAAISLLSADEMVRWERFRFATDRDLFLSTRVLARTLLSRYSRIPPRLLRFSAGAAGKPELITPPGRLAIRFNLSNTIGLVACAVTDRVDVGVDVEAIRDAPRGVPETVFTPPELSTLYGFSERDRSRAFFALWTLKESFIKATGEGLSSSLQDFAVGLAPPRLLDYGRGIAECKRWQFACFEPMMSHTVALCVAISEPHEVDVIPRWLSVEPILATISEGSTHT